jgi:hypothetical protein
MSAELVMGAHLHGWDWLWLALMWLSGAIFGWWLAQ